MLGPTSRACACTPTEYDILQKSQNVWEKQEASNAQLEAFAQRPCAKGCGAVGILHLHGTGAIHSSPIPGTPEDVVEEAVAPKAVSPTAHHDPAAAAAAGICGLQHEGLTNFLGSVLQLSWVAFVKAEYYPLPLPRR
eukprot:evm.model.scf_454.9 EVM.evm.TU.scf_454.9   scf_454:70788-71198(+)